MFRNQSDEAIELGGQTYFATLSKKGQRRFSALKAHRLGDGDVIYAAKLVVTSNVAAAQPSRKLFGLLSQYCVGILRINGRDLEAGDTVNRCRVVKQFPNSLAAAERLVALAPDSFGSYELRACVFSHLGNYVACIQDCDRSIQLKPDHAIAWAMHGEAKVAIGDKPGGKRDLDHAAALAGGDEYFKTLRDAALAQHHE